MIFETSPFFLNLLSCFLQLILFCNLSWFIKSYFYNTFAYLILTLVFLLLSNSFSINSIIMIILSAFIFFMRLKIFNQIIGIKKSNNYLYYTFFALLTSGTFYLFRYLNPIEISVNILALSLLFSGISFLVFKYKGIKILFLSGLVNIIEFIFLIHYTVIEFFKLSEQAFFNIFALFDFLNIILIISGLIYYFINSHKNDIIKLPKETLYNLFHDAIFIIDNGIIINCNDVAISLFKYTSNQMIGMNIADIHPLIQQNGETSQNTFKNFIEQTGQGKEIHTEWLYQKSDGTNFLAEINIKKYPGSNGKKIIITAKDITSIKKIENIAKIASVTFENSFEGAFVLNSEGVFLFANTSLIEMIGYKAEEIIGKCESCFRANIPDETVYEKIKHTVIGNGKWSGELWNKKKNGTLFLSMINLSIMKNDSGKIDKIVGTIIDITEYSRDKEQLNQYQNFDRLTGLINKENFTENLSRKLLDSSINIAVFNIDINNFKSINDTFGFVKSDNLLFNYSVRLKNIVSSKKKLCRYSVDEFIFFFEHCDTELQISQIIEKIFETVRNPFVINGEEVCITISLGIALSSSISKSPQNLIKKANIALHDAKRKGNNQFSIYNKEMKKTTYYKLKLENDLRSAIKKNSITTFFQAKVDSKTEKIVGMETLARWIDKNNQIISPNNFIPLAEHTGLIFPMTEKIITSAINWTDKWNTKNTSNLRVAINLSAKHFQDYNLIGFVENILEKTSINGENLEFEITESAFLTNSNAVSKIIKSIKKMGIHISLDDFGTGYSSLSYLKKIPLDGLKIDKSFIDDIEYNPQSRKLLKSIITIAKDLNLNTVAEGVENKIQKEILINMECDMLQGYLFSKPLNPDDFSNLLDSTKPPAEENTKINFLNLLRNAE